jgi:sRNA-binding carbon storage regulator CsrA
MLILSRREGETITIRVPAGPARVIVLTAEECRHDKMRIGLVADREVEIYRSELLAAPAIAAKPQP